MPTCRYERVKQSREPKDAAEYEGPLIERAQAKPAAAPSFAAPPQETPRSDDPDDGIDV